MLKNILFSVSICLSIFLFNGCESTTKIHVIKLDSNTEYNSTFTNENYIWENFQHSNKVVE
jgi:hypothetical protein